MDPVDPTGFSQLIETALCKRDGERSHDVPIGEYLMAPQMFDICYYCTGFFKNHSKGYKRLSAARVYSARIQCRDAKDACLVSMDTDEYCSLICSVNYKTSSDEKMYFRKFFKFPVGKPIDVKTKFYNAENNDVYLEAQIENTATTPMVLERVELEASPNYVVSSVSSCDDDELTGMYLKPRDIRQFLFCLSPKDAHSAVYKDMTNIGKLDMSWRTSMGERGRLQTSPLQRIAPTHGDVRLSVENLPATVPVRKPFTVDCKLYNCCERSLDLQLELQNMSSTLVFCSISGVSLGQLPPNGSVSFSVEMLPISIGFQVITFFSVDFAAFVKLC
ncbi:unnamed protein product [Heligmosomoides polygyrus]|uniref:Trafficking protein particle complex subunit 13 n=1 Tax=Heligmosomoides polygyrus TaxID=6339 RepID=A0A183FGW4_HELPZ|nr:unnamed protein product [Heligmosomoides polygyrus]